MPLGSQDPAKGTEAAALLFGLARAQMAMVQRHEILQAADSLGRAFSHYADTGDGERAVEITEYPYYSSYGQSLGVTKPIARALELVPAESHQEGRLLCRYGSLLGMEEGDYIGAQEAFARALSTAERESDTILEMGTLASAARVDRSRHDYNEALQKSLRAIELARQLNDLRVEVAARFEATSVLRITGELEQARQHALPMLKGAERLRDRFWLSSALNRNGFLCSSIGDWRSAREFSDRGLAASPGDYRNLAHRAEFEYEVGDFDQGRVHLERLLEIMRLTPPGPRMPNTLSAQVIPLIARITGLGDRLEVAEGAAQTVLSSPSVTLIVAQFAVCGLGLLAVLRQDVVAARQQYASLQHVRGTTLQVGVVAIDRMLGLLAHTMGDLDQAMTHFEDALAFCRKAGYRPELAWTCCDYADTLLQRNEPGDRDKAVSLLDESLSISTELGMRPLMDRVAAIQEQIRLQPESAPAYPDGLTQREVEVLCLIAAGKTDRDIAEELVIAESTVRRHVSNIYAKIGASNRVEAATYATRPGLV